jgi:CRISPR-associated protein Csb2
LSKNVSPPEKGGHKKLWLQAWNVMPDQRKRSGLKERHFPAARLHNPIIRLCWPRAEPDRATLSALQELARDTAYVGHSASLTRCRFLLEDAPDLSKAASPQWRVYPERLKELRETYARLEKSGDKKDRPKKGARVTPSAQPEPKRCNVFGERWLLLEHVAGEMPDLRACALVARTLRDALLSGHRQIGLGNNIPEVVSGHSPDGTPTRAAHLAIVPLAFAGFPHSDGHVMGFALIPPRDSTMLDDESFRKVLGTLARVDEGYGRRILTLTTKESTPSDRAFSISLSPTFEPPASRRSLDPALYVQSSRTFATVTPTVLDRHLKEKGEARQEEIAAQIRSACRNIGLPEPEAIVADKHSAIKGAPSAYPSGKSPAWMGWRLPPSLASRQLTHAVIRFAEPVDGPVIVGAGRFLGLGLCRPLAGEAH